MSLPLHRLLYMKIFPMSRRNSNIFPDSRKKSKIFPIINAEGDYMLSERLQRICDAKNISFNQLERECGLSNGSLKKWKTSTPSVDKVKTVADYFGVSVDFLLTGREAMLTESDSEKISYNCTKNRTNKRNLPETEQRFSFILQRKTKKPPKMAVFFMVEARGVEPLYCLCII